MAGCERMMQVLVAALVIFVVFGIFANWMSGALEREKKNEVAKTEQRISRIKDEYNRKVEETIETWKNQMQQKVDEKLPLLVEEATKAKDEEIGKLKGDIEKLKQERNKWKETLQAVNEQFNSVKKQIEENLSAGE